MNQVRDRRASFACFESSEASLEPFHLSPPISSKSEVWTLGDHAGRKNQSASRRLPIKAFNHVTREVISLEKSLDFYVNILGFDEIARPDFGCPGAWLWGYGLSLHLIVTTVPAERKQTKKARLKHFSEALPRVDHIAFTTGDFETIKAVLDREKVFYKYDCPSADIRQFFFFDPDGNVIEISNCAPEIGFTTCSVGEHLLADNIHVTSSAHARTISTESVSSACGRVQSESADSAEAESVSPSYTYTLGDAIHHLDDTTSSSSSSSSSSSTSSSSCLSTDRIDQLAGCSVSNA